MSVCARVCVFVRKILEHPVTRTLSDIYQAQIPILFIYFTFPPVYIYYVVAQAIWCNFCLVAREKKTKPIALTEGRASGKVMEQERGKENAK